MTIINYKALLWTLLAVPIVILYLWRARPGRRSVPTGFLWEQVFSTPRRRSAWWSLRHPASLCLQLVVLALVVFALTEPHLRPPPRLVLIIDNSDSMNATDVQPTRLDHAKQLAGQYIQALGYRDQMAIITAGDTVRVHCGLTSLQDALWQALQAVTATTGPTRVADAVALARRLLDGSPNGKIVVLSDGCFDGAMDLAGQDEVELIAVGGPGDNVGITRLEARRSPADPLRCQVLAEVTSFADEPVRCHLKLELNGKAIPAVPVELAAGGRWQQVFEMTPAEGGELTASLDRSDVFPNDDHASTPVPSCRIHQVTLVTDGSLYLEKVLQAISRVELTVADTPPEKAARGMILVLDRRVPRPLPQGPMLAIDPPGRCELWDLGDSVENAVVARQNEDLPLLADVRLEGVRLSEVRRLELTDEARSRARPLAWTAEGVAVAYAIDRPGGRVLVLSGVLEPGDLPLKTAFPILITNALEWVAAPGGTSASRLATDGTCAGPLDGGRLAMAWSDASESDIRVPAGLASGAEAAVSGLPGPPLWLFPVAVVLLLVVAEWYSFQRRWTC